MSAVLRAQLYAVRGLIDAMLIGLGESLEAPRALGSCPHCGAPEEKQVDASTLAAPNKKLCLICQREHDG